MKLIIASSNVHKIREMRVILRKSPNFDLFSLMDFPSYVPLEETGLTFEENAKTKAIHAAKSLNSWTIADDSGLVIPALHGVPGVFSARYAGPNATDKENRKKLLDEMKHLQEQYRDGYYECCIALASPDGIQKIVSARCEGSLTEQERGGQGFGYDPIFKKHDYNKTFAELEEEVKNQISHRGKAMNKMLLILETIAHQLADIAP